MKKIVVIAACLLVAIPLVASAAIIRSGPEVTLRQADSYTDDVYIAGGTVTSTATIEGDLVVGGGTIFIGGTVTEDVIAGGGNINLVGTVGDDARLAGGNITVSGSVADNAVVAGGQIMFLSGSSVGGDAFLSGGRVVVSGTIGGNLQINAAQVVVDGNIVGDVQIRATDIEIGENAVIGGALSYQAPRQARISETASVAGETTFDRIVRPERSTGLLAGGVFLKFLTHLITALLVVWLARRVAQMVVVRAGDSMLRNLLVGFAVLVLTPIAVVIAMITLVGIPIGALSIFTYVVLIGASYLFLPILYGALLWRYWHHLPGYPVAAVTVLGGSLLITVLGIIPVLGWVVNFVATLIVLGAIVSLSVQFVRRRSE